MLNDTRWKIVEEARSWVETPFKHQGRRKGQDVDCAGLALACWWALDNRLPEELKTVVRSYTRGPIDNRFEEMMDTHLIEIPKEAVQPGDLALLKYDVIPHHVGIFGDYRGLSLIHASLKQKKVIEHRLDESWWKYRIVKCYKYSGVDNE